MTNRERFRRTLNFEPVDRLPMIEWAGWWDKTIARWYDEGLPRTLTTCEAIRDYFGQDGHRQYWIPARGPGCPGAPGHGLPIVSSPDDYLRIKEYLYPDPAFDANLVRGWAEGQKAGDLAIWISLDGFFWYPRTLLGIEGHLLAFYDQPDLMKEMNEDILKFQ
ncbi:MAG: hypothetical protein NTU88_07550, partial [Armatimonadetes bacterium]|nr:hypothetical protein [Armatimonadota bacterium]